MYALTRIRKVSLIALLFTAALALGQGTKITPPKNSYKVADDVKVGREAAAQVAKEMPLLAENGDVDSYVERVGAALAAAIPAEFAHSEFRYDFSVVNAADINAFALPGGPMFVNRGMIEAATSEGEMAGVLAHEISHVALRHGTAQASKAGSAGVQLGSIGGAILGAIIGGNAGDVISQGTQMGLGIHLMKFSREYETQADILGAQILARAGYDPNDLAKMFQTIEQQGSRSGPEWLSSHPNPGNRYARIAEEAKKLTINSRRRAGQQAEFAQAQASLRRMAAAPSAEAIARAKKGEGGNGNTYPEDSRISRTVARPSTRYRTFQADGYFSLSVPDNWNEFEGASSVTFAPEGAYGNQQGESVFTHGAMVGVIANASSTDLRSASDQYVSGILQGNAYLTANGNYQRTRLDGREALRRRLSGNSPVTKQKEMVDIYTVLMDRGQLFYMVHVVPGNVQGQYTQAFGELARSVRFVY
jgi:Zn-dependent protease with chaperone function